jgi:hypothetical protein
MTDRVKGFVVTLEQDVRIDDIEPMLQAIRYMRGVANVEPSIADSSDWINQQRIKNDLRGKLQRFINETL